jgi:hypothetical protein
VALTLLLNSIPKKGITMSETGNIEELAKIISKDIFNYLKWNICKPKDVDWKCEAEHHKKKTHPSDVVFYYDDPYSGHTKYLNTDLKSYASATINKGSVTNALKNLAMSVECANVSGDWQDKFLLNPLNFGDVSGLLFIYNHDGAYDKDFDSLVKQIDLKELAISEDNQIIAMGPKLIERLLNVVTDIKLLKSDDLFPGPDNYSFFYPDLIRSRRCGDEWNKPATLEAISSPWLIIKHKNGQNFNNGFVIYYHETGETVDEFIYMLDAMSHYQMFSADYSLRLRFTKPSSNAVVNFEKAKHEYSRMWGNDEARKLQMDRIDASQIINYSTCYNPMEIGMRDHD